VLVGRHGYTHIRSRKGKNEDEALTQQPQSYVLPQALKDQLVLSSQKHFEEVLNQSFEKMHKDLEVTTQHVNNLVIRLASEIVSGELEKYRTEFTHLSQKASADMNGIREELAKHRQELETQLAKEVDAEKQKLLKQIDTKLGDAMASFLLESLQHNVDLGNQSQYLVSMLEEHKADFKKEVGDETQSAK
jgi:hypothetical protein